MDESFLTRLKQACGLAADASFLTDESDDETYDPELDPEVTSLLFESDSSDSDGALSDDSAVVDLRKLVPRENDAAVQDNVALSNGGPQGVGFNSADVPSSSATMSANDVSVRLNDSRGSGVSRKTLRRTTYETAMRRIAAWNADDSDDEEDLQESDSSPIRTKRTRLNSSSSSSSSTVADTPNGGDNAEAVSSHGREHRYVRRRAEHRRSCGGRRGGGGLVGGGAGRGQNHSSLSRGEQPQTGGRMAKKVEERARYYEQRPAVGSRRFQAGPDAGATQNGIFYGPGIISNDDFLQPRDRTYPSVKIMPQGYGWRGRPKRKPMHFEFKPKRAPGVHHMKPEWTCAEMFEMLWKDCEVIWRTATNDKGREICAKTGATFKEVTKVETYAFLACKLWIDLFRKPVLRMYWSHVLDFCSPFIVRARESSGMSHRRFQQIKVWTRLYDKNLASTTGMNNPKALNYDVSHKAREYLDAMNRSCEWFMEPDRIISFDESMLEYTGIGGEKQTIRSKPIPTGLMFYAACTNRGYFLRTLLHAKQTLPYWQEMGVPFATVWSILSGALCPGMANYLDSGRTLITDRAYTSVSLAYALAFRDTYFIGTVKRNLKCVPDCLIKQRDEKGLLKTVNKSAKSSMCRGDTYFLHDNAGVVSFCAWQDNELVPLLYTTETVEEMTVCKRLVKGGNRSGNEFERPLILQEYDAGMGGVDIGDQHIAAQHRPTRCYVWYTPILFRSFDILCNNVFCIKQAFGYQIPMLSVKLNIAYGMLQKSQELAGAVKDGVTATEMAEVRVHDPYSVRSAERAPCDSCGVRATTGCATCAVVCHLDDCWKEVHRRQNNAIN